MVRDPPMRRAKAPASPAMRGVEVGGTSLPLCGPEPTGCARPIALVMPEGPARRELAAYLAAHGFELTLAERFDVFRRPAPALVLHEIGAHALALCARVRAAGEPLPMVLLAAEREAPVNCAALELGADDFVGPPHAAPELVARLRALLRRCQPSAGTAGPQAPAALRIGMYRFVPHSRRLQGPQGTHWMSSAQSTLLDALAARLTEPVSRLELLVALHGHADAARMRSVDVAMMRLRRLLEPDPTEPRHVQTVRGCGYRLVP